MFVLLLFVCIMFTVLIMFMIMMTIIISVIFDIIIIIIMAIICQYYWKENIASLMVPQERRSPAGDPEYFCAAPVSSVHTYIYTHILWVSLHTHVYNTLRFLGYQHHCSTQGFRWCPVGRGSCQARAPDCFGSMFSGGSEGALSGQDRSCGGGICDCCKADPESQSFRDLSWHHHAAL